MIKTVGLTKKFNDKTVIYDLNLTLNKGSKLTVFAPSGAGKTTLIHILNGLDKNFSGKIFVKSKLTSTIFQEPRLFNYMNVRENIFFPFRLNKINIDDKIISLYHKWLNICELEDYEKYYPHQISGGMKQKTALIRGYLFNPQIIFMDEPFKSIDIRSKYNIIKFIKNYYNDITIFFTTHNLDEIPMLSDKLLLFKDKKLYKFKEININKDFDLQEIYDNIIK
ncbi:MAG: ATP-binding cassette domain-containing protein [Spirochaetes bacterium]|nr:ATP-binding cassette domain-containing protein [Spirochaetota bacterium]